MSIFWCSNLSSCGLGLSIGWSKHSHPANPWNSRNTCRLAQKCKHVCDLDFLIWRTHCMMQDTCLIISAASNPTEHPILSTQAWPSSFPIFKAKLFPNTWYHCWAVLLLMIHILLEFDQLLQRPNTRSVQTIISRKQIFWATAKKKSQFPQSNIHFFWRHTVKATW